jgi:hypothetical protein
MTRDDLAYLEPFNQTFHMDAPLINHYANRLSRVCS